MYCLAIVYFPPAPVNRDYDIEPEALNSLETSLITPAGVAVYGLTLHF